MSIEEVLEAVKNGTCPFTKKQYDCACCECEKYSTDWMNKGEHTIHLGLDITRPLAYGERGWRDTLRFFEPRDRKAARQMLTMLLQHGVEQIPIGNCDAAHFCFKRGCDGHKVESEVDNGNK